MEFFNQTYVALRGPTGQVQTPADTIGKLSDRLSPATLLADRRAAVLSLKGLSRDWKEDVGNRALAGLIDVLANDAEVDADIGKAVLETLIVLCDTEDTANNSKALGFKHTDIVLANERATHVLFSLLKDTDFYSRLSSLQFLLTLLQNRRQLVQGYFLTAPAGPGSIIGVLDDKREVVRNEGISVFQSLISQSPEIQKVLTFEGAFEKLFNIVNQEGGIDGGIVAHGALTCVDGLLRFNSSNQSYFKETPLFPLVSQLLQFPIMLKPSDLAPQEFALQFWDEQKQANASVIIGILGIFVNSKSSGHEGTTLARCFLEIALASNAPTPLKVQALRLLPPNLNIALAGTTITPYIPVPDTNGEEWDRLEPASLLDALIELVLNGEYNGILDGGKRTKEGLELRTSAAVVFENFARTDEVRLAVMQSMAPPEANQPPRQITPLLHALAQSPLGANGTLDAALVTSLQMADILFAHLVRLSPRSKAVARTILPQPAPSASNSAFFVPADGGPPPQPEVGDDDQDPPQSLLQTLSENLSLALLARSRPDTSDEELREWDRLVIAYISLLSQWLWEDPASVRDFLDAGGLSVLVEGINQASEVDSFVPGLCTFLLGICYEFNREPGEITRKTIYPILGRLGIDSLIGQLTRFREDDRFRAVGPDTVVLTHHSPSLPGHEVAKEDSEVWFDWAFVDFWKSNYYAIQRAFSTDPDQLSAGASGPSAETAMLISSLRDVIRKQSEEMEGLRHKLHEGASGNEKKIADLEKALSEAQAQAKSAEDQRKVVEKELSDARAQAKAAEDKRKEVEKEQEDLLVLLDETTSKRRKDKGRLREAGLEVSEDEEDDDDEDDEEDD